MKNQKIIQWLLEGDPAIEYQVRRDLLGQDPFSETALENQLNLMKTLLRAVFEYQSGHGSGIIHSVPPSQT